MFNKENAKADVMKKYLKVRVSDEMHALLKDISEKENCGISDLVRRSIDNFFFRGDNKWIR